MKKVGILYHPKIPAAVALAGDLSRSSQFPGTSVWLCSAWEEEEAKAKVAGTDLIVSIGGDGTILRAARAVVPWPIPILGINLGRLGFMTELSPAEALERAPDFLRGEGWVEERAMLRAEFSPAGSGESLSFHALNDVVVGRGAVTRVVHVHAIIDGEPLTTYRADGVIVATATGSTGYSLSVGGPILHPQAKELLLTPICAHLSLATALVLSSSSTVELEVRTDHQAMLSIDGQVDVKLGSGDKVKVRRSPHVTRFLRFQPSGYFYRTLMQRLHPRHEGTV